MGRVGTGIFNQRKARLRKEIKEIATLWINYLNSEPDQISENPYWNDINFTPYDE